MSNYIELTKSGELLYPANEETKQYLSNCIDGEILYLKEASRREIGMHRCYFSLVNMVYDYMPEYFKQHTPRKIFYLFLKDIQGEYRQIIYPSGRIIKDYTSISFSKMTEKKFKEYIAKQMPIIYEDVLGAYFEGDILKNIIETIELNYNKFLNELYK